MTWANPWILFTLIPLCILGALVQYVWRQRILHKQKSIGSAQQTLTRSVHGGLQQLRFFSLWLAMILLVCAMAGPRWGSEDVQRKSTGAYVVFAIDCSRSMMAEDMYPNRMKSAHFKALDFMKENPEHRIALLPFARIATLRTPFTGDHQAIAEMIEDCTPKLFPAKYGFQGTAIGESVIESCRLLQKHVGSSLAIIILSDGSDKDKKRIEEAQQEAQKHGIRIYGLFFGDTEREVSITIDGQKHIMHADKGTLDNLATHTGGISVNSTTDNQDILSISQHIAENVSFEDWEEQQRVIASERYQFFLLPAILLMGLMLLLPSRRFIHA